MSLSTCWHPPWCKMPTMDSIQIRSRKAWVSPLWTAKKNWSTEHIVLLVITLDFHAWAELEAEGKNRSYLWQPAQQQTALHMSKRWIGDPCCSTHWHSSCCYWPKLHSFGKCLLLEKPLNPLQKMTLEMIIDLNEQHHGPLNLHIPTNLSLAETVFSTSRKQNFQMCNAQQQ